MNISGCEHGFIGLCAECDGAGQVPPDDREAGTAPELLDCGHTTAEHAEDDCGDGW